MINTIAREQAIEVYVERLKVKMKDRLRQVFIAQMNAYGGSLSSDAGIA